VGPTARHRPPQRHQRRGEGPRPVSIRTAMC
jgi:hypothetical protein